MGKRKKVPRSPFFWFNPTKRKLESLGQERMGIKENLATERKVKYHKANADPDSMVLLHGSHNLCQSLLLPQQLKYLSKTAEICLKAHVLAGSVEMCLLLTVSVHEQEPRSPCRLSKYTRENWDRPARRNKRFLEGTRPPQGCSRAGGSWALFSGTERGEAELSTPGCTKAPTCHQHVPAPGVVPEEHLGDTGQEPPAQESPLSPGQERGRGWEHHGWTRASKISSLSMISASQPNRNHSWLGGAHSTACRPPCEASPGHVPRHWPCSTNRPGATTGPQDSTSLMD